VLPAYKAGFPIPHVLLATSTCISAAVNTFLLWRGLRRDGVYRPGPGWWRLLVQIGVASVAMGALLWWLGGDLAGWIAAGALERAARLALCVVAGAVAYFGVLFLLGVRPAQLRAAHS
jgi:putative peptidoglycan lipid II flippase